MFLNIPILVIKSKIAEITRTQRWRVTHWEDTEWVFFYKKMMRLWIKNSFRSWYSMALSVTWQFRESVDENMDLGKGIIDIVPPSEFFSTYNIIMKNLEAADSFSTQSHVATGAETVALLDESLAPRIPPTWASSTRKRSATVSSPEAAAGGPEEEDDRPIKKFKSTKFGPNQCPCGVHCIDRRWFK